MDERYNVRTALADAYAGLGHVAAAREQLELAQRAAPSERLSGAIAAYERMEADARVAQAYVDLAPSLPDEAALSLYARLPDGVKAFGRTRDVAAPLMLKGRSSTQPRLLVWCGRSAEPWGPPKLNETGLGGSETAVVEIGRRFAADGWRVDVYNAPGRYEGVHDGVGYWEHGRLLPGEGADLLVSWRQPAAHALPVQRRAAVAWLHDHNHGADAARDLRAFDRVLGVSAYHAAFLAEAYGLTAVGHVPNGVDLDRFDRGVRKVPFRCVYASSPDRGLTTLLELWPAIRGAEKSAELHVAYGFDTMDRWIAAGRHDLAEFKASVLDLLERTEGVVYRARLPQDELARLYAESYAWLYPADFLETSCISAMEAMAGGAVPVVSSVGALKDTVGTGGLVVWGPGGTRSNPYSPAWRDFYVQCARAVLYERTTRLGLEARARERAKGFTWDAAYDRWKTITEELLAGRTPELVAA
jgi:glycosyltransferase involved in cell wall biosynthesis